MDDSSSSDLESMCGLYVGFYESSRKLWQGLRQFGIVSKERPKHIRHCKCDALISRIWQGREAFALPLDRGSMTTAWTEGTFARVEDSSLRFL
jgi:hypothetical protein